MGRTLVFFLLVFCLPLTNAGAASIVLDPSKSQVLIVGQIVSGDFLKFSTLLKHAPSYVNTVDIISQGGNVEEAIQIGRLIRALSLSAGAPSTAAYAPQARAQMCGEASHVIKGTACTCASACFLIWAGGVSRFGNDILIHRVFFDKAFYGALSPTDAKSKYQAEIEMVHSYLKEMEIPDSIYEKMISMPSYDVAPLTEADDLDIRLVPSFHEWIIARCGMMGSAGQCFFDESKKAAAAALAQYQKTDQTPAN